MRYAVPSASRRTTSARSSPAPSSTRTLASWARGTVKISWPANWDRDNEQLTYSVIRNGDIANPIYTTTQLSSEWSRPPMGYLDQRPGAG